MVALIQMALVLSTGRNDPTVYAAFGAGAGAYLFYRGFHMLQRTTRAFRALGATAGQ